ncbi:uncharacterized protein LOC114672829 isoform X2 [Macaca mulatta]
MVLQVKIPVARLHQLSLDRGHSDSTSVIQMTTSLRSWQSHKKEGAWMKESYPLTWTPNYSSVLELLESWIIVGNERYFDGISSH